MKGLDEHFARQESEYYADLHRKEQIERIADDLAEEIDDVMWNLGVNAYCEDYDSLYEVLLERAEEIWEEENE